jgi:hypothetical protein
MSSAGQQAADQVQAHAECPWCGGRARLEWEETCQGIPAIRPVCASCGEEAPAALPWPGGAASLECYGPEYRASRLSPAWEAWDNASWVRERARMHAAGDRLAHVVEQLLVGRPLNEDCQAHARTVLSEWVDACTDTRRPW